VIKLLARLRALDARLLDLQAQLLAKMPQQVQDLFGHVGGPLVRILFILWTVLAIARRLATIGAEGHHLSALDLTALVASAALAALIGYSVLTHRYAQGFFAGAISACFSLFLLLNVDLPRLTPFQSRPG